MKDDFDLKKLIKPKRINSKKKGSTYENQLAKKLNDRFNTTDFMRTPGSGAFATSHKLPDHLIIYGDLIAPSNFNFIVESKRGYNKLGLFDLINYTSDVFKFLAQNRKDCEKCKKNSLVIIKQDRKKELAILSRYANPSYDYELELQLIEKPYVVFGGKHIMAYLDDILLLPDYIFLA